MSRSSVQIRQAAPSFARGVAGVGEVAREAWGRREAGHVRCGYGWQAMPSILSAIARRAKAEGLPKEGISLPALLKWLRLAGLIPVLL